MTRAQFPPQRMNAAEEVLGPPLAAGLGDEIALICGQRSMTYAALEQLVDRYARGLRAQGVRIENRVLFVMDDSTDLVALYLATLKIGAVAVACNVRASSRDLHYMIEDTRCALAVVDCRFLELWREAALETHPAPVFVRGGAGREPGIETLRDADASPLPYAAMTADDMAFWLYTSGTTGTPKAVVHCHHDVRIADLHLRENLHLRPGERIFTTSKLFFAFALGHSLLGGLRTGATVVLYEGWPDANSIIAEVERTRPALLLSVPTFYRNMLDSGVENCDAFRAIRYCVSSGERLPTALFDRWRAATGIPLLEGIGTSETVFLFLANTPRAYKPGSAGRPLPWSSVRLLDDDGKVIETPDTIGTLWVRMGSVFDRYWNQQERTRAVFRDGYYCTGDSFSFDVEGYWHHSGRSDDMMKISGQWVSPSEIEECALKLPEVIDAAAIGAPNADGLVRTALFVVSVPGTESAPLEAALRETLTANLSIYKCPRNIRFLDEIPRTATGKIQRYKLREML